MKTEEVRITHHELSKHYLRADVEQKEPFGEVPDQLDFVVALPIKKRLVYTTTTQRSLNRIF